MPAVAHIVLGLLLALLILVCLANRLPPPMPKNPCKCPGCEIEHRHRNDLPLRRSSNGVKHA